MGFAVFLAIFIAFIYIIKGGLFYKFIGKIWINPFRLFVDCRLYLPYELCLDIITISIYKIGLKLGKNLAKYWQQLYSNDK